MDIQFVTVISSGLMPRATNYSNSGIFLAAILFLQAQAVLAHYIILYMLDFIIFYCTYVAKPKSKVYLFRFRSEHVEAGNTGYFPPTTGGRSR